MVLTWNIRPSGEYVEADKSYPVPMEVIVNGESAKRTRKLERRVTVGDSFISGKPLNSLK